MIFQEHSALYFKCRSKERFSKTFIRARDMLKIKIWNSSSFVILIQAILKYRLFYIWLFQISIFTRFLLKCKYQKYVCEYFGIFQILFYQNEFLQIKIVYAFFRSIVFF